MKRNGLVLCGTAIIAIAVGSGCAGEDPNKRIAAMEEQNRGLKQQLDACRGQLHAANRNRGECDQALLAARRENDDLRNQLANAPSPEPAAPGWTSVPGGAMISIEGEVLFSPGKNVIRNEAAKTLDAISSAIQGQYADKDVLVFGHTDAQPIRKSGWDDNWQLSSERSLAVVRALQSRGVTPSRLVACGAGEYRPRTSNDAEAGRAKNRRVEIFAIDPHAQSGRP